MELTLFVAQALLCSALQCWPVLVGPKTEQFIGNDYPLIRRLTDDVGYGGEVLQFAETSTTVYAIHKVWTLKPNERREQRLLSNNSSDRVITNGCVNVDPALYSYLVENFTTLTVRP